MPCSPNLSLRFDDSPQRPPKRQSFTRHANPAFAQRCKPPSGPSAPHTPLEKTKKKPRNFSPPLLASNKGQAPNGLCYPLVQTGGQRSPTEDQTQAPWLKPLSLGSQLDALLPDGGLPRGAVVEIASNAQLGRSTQIALAACAAAQQQARKYTQQAQSSWCAWIDPRHSLYAPGVAQSGVDLNRLLVVSPQPEHLLKAAVRLNRCGVFSVVVIARHSPPGHRLFSPHTTSHTPLQKAAAARSMRWDLATRRLAMVASKQGTTVILLSSLAQAKRMPLPVALRLELQQYRQDKLALRIAKERYGRTGPQRQLQLFLSEANNPSKAKPAPSSRCHLQHGS